MSKRTGSKRRPLLYVYVSLSVTSVDPSVNVTDDRRGEGDYRGPRRESIYQGVHGCYCCEAVEERGILDRLEFNYMLSTVERMSVRRTATAGTAGTASEYEKSRNRHALIITKLVSLVLDDDDIRIPRLPEATTPFTPHSPYRAKPSLPLHQLSWYASPPPLQYISLTSLSSLFNTLNAHRQK